MDPISIALIVLGLAGFTGAIWLGRALQGPRGIRRLKAALPGATLTRGELSATVDVDRAISARVRSERGGVTVRLACPVAPLRGRPRFTTSDAIDENSPLHATLNPLFSSNWEVQLVHVVDGDLVLEAHQDGDYFERNDLVQFHARHLAQLADALEVQLALEGAQGLRCPACDVVLDEARGELHEAVCPDCRGRFLPRGAVERLMGGELGKTPTELKEAASGTRAVERCPACEHRMSPIPVEDVIVALCTGCGGAWLDEGELRAISAGRYAEL